MPADDRLLIKVGSVERAAIVRAPPGHGDAAMPLLLVLHGGRGGSDAIAKLTGFDAIARREGFVVAYPEALGGNWNDGRPGTRPRREDQDDVRFIRALIAELSRLYPIDHDRIFAAGMSNGGMMCHRLGLEMPDVFAGIASVAGTMAAAIAPANGNGKPTPRAVIGIYGTEDPIVPWDGGEVRRGASGRLLGARESMAVWARLMACSPSPARETLPDTVKDGTHVWRETHEGCREGARLLLYGIEGGGHGWPPRGIGRTGPIARALVGRVSHNLDATQVIWEFFTGKAP